MGERKRTDVGIKINTVINSRQIINLANKFFVYVKNDIQRHMNFSIYKFAKICLNIIPFNYLYNKLLLKAHLARTALYISRVCEFRTIIPIER